MNMSDFEDESTSESENEGDFSDSSEYTPEQHLVRTNSNILMPKETKVSKAKEIPKRAKKLHQNQLIIRVPQSMLYWLIKQPPHQVRNMLLHLQKYLKYLKPKKYPKRAKKLHQNWLIIRVPQSVLYWLIKQPPHQVRNMLLHLQKYLKYLKPKKYPKRAKKLHRNWLIIRVPQKSALLADQTATTSGEEHVASPPKVSKVSKAKEIPKRAKKPAPKLVDNQNATKSALLADQNSHHIR